MDDLDPVQRPSPARRFAFASLFAVCTALLTIPLWASLGLLPPERHDDPEARSQFAEDFLLEQQLKTIVGIAELAKKVAGDQAPKLERQLGDIEKTVISGEHETHTLKGWELRLITYHHLQLKDAEDRAIEVLAWRAVEAPAVGENDSETLAGDAGTTSVLTALDVRLIELYREDRPLSEADIQSLESKLGFFGKLVALRNAKAAGQELPTELAQSISDEAFRHSAIFLVFILGVFLAGLTGVSLLSVFIYRILNGRIQWLFSKWGTPPWIFFETFTLYFAFMVLARRLADLLGLSPMAGMVFAAGFVFIIAAYPLLMGVKGATLRAELGLTRGAGFWREIGYGPVGYVAMIPLVGVGITISMALSRITGIKMASGMHPIVNLVKEGKAAPALIALIFLLAVVGAPIVEELMFRGYLYRALRSRFSAAASIPMVSALFAGIHPQGLMGFFPLFFIGLALAVMREWRGTLWASMVLHACVNGVSMTMILLL